MKKVLVGLAMLILLSSFVLAATITVNPGDSIQTAINSANPGDIINVNAGTYNEQINLNKNDLTIRSAAGAATTTITPTDTTAGGIFITGSNNIFEGFTVRDYSNNANENKIIRIHNDANNNIIKNNIVQGNLNQGGITDQTEYGILCYGSNNLIDSNEVYDIGYIGINIVGQPHSYASGNTISNNNIHDIGIYGITVDRAKQNTITKNTISDLVGGTLWGDSYDPETSCWGVVVWGATATGTKVVEQTVEGLPNGISLSAAQGVTVENCEIKNNDFIGIRLAGSSWLTDNVKDNTIQNNEITGNSEGVVIKDDTASVIGTGNLINWNNIYSNPIRGVRNYAVQEINAEYNWWGASDGPGNIGPGSGDMVSARVDYNPWLKYPIATGSVLTRVNKIEQQLNDVDDRTVLLESWKTTTQATIDAMEAQLESVKQYIFYWDYRATEDDICVAISKECTQILIECREDTDCGHNGYEGSNYCQDNSVYGTYRTYTCENPGTVESFCSSSTEEKHVINCGAGFTCTNGTCEGDIECHTDNDCGTNGYVDGNYCGGDENVYKGYKTYTCNNPGTTESSCSDSTTPELVEICRGEEFCNNGECVSYVPEGVIFRTNADQTTPDNCAPLVSTSKWIAYDLNEDGNLEGYGYYNTVKFGSCSGAELVQTPNGCQLYAIETGDGLGVNYNNRCVHLKTNGVAVKNAVLSKDATEPYASNNQELYS